MQLTALWNRYVAVDLIAVAHEQRTSRPARLFRFFAKTFLPGRQALLIMKLTMLLLLFGLLTAHADGLSQTISFSGKKTKITQVFQAIEKQTGYTIFANKELVKAIKPVTITARDLSLRTFLDIVFRDQPVDYEINNRTIFIKEKIVPISRPDPPPPVQKITVTGTIISTDGAPLAGATITIKGTPTSVTSDESGRFSISAEPNDVLIISYVGFQQIEVAINGRTSINVSLEKSVGEIEQVVVTALGITRKTKALTYNVQEVKGEELNKVKDANFVNSLNGKVAGVTINTAASGVGGPARVISRGAKSLFRNNNTLYVIDGIPLPDISSTQPNDVFQGAGQTGDGISNINPEDIASISVLTGPAAAALYGSQAANGVVMIVTRKGSAEKLKVSVSNNTSFYSPLLLPEFQNRYGSDPGSFYSWGAKLKTTSDYDPADFFQTGTNITNSISLSTGTERNQTYFSGAIVKAKGIIPNNDLSRYNFSVRNTASFLDDRLHLDISLMYIRANEQNMLSQGQYFNPLIPIYLFPRSDDMARYEAFERFNPSRNFNTQFWPYGDMGFQMQNPHWIINRDFFNNNKKRYIFSTGLKYDVADWVNITGRVKLDNNSTVAEKKFYASTSGLFASPAGAYYKSTAETQQIYADVIASANRTFRRDYNVVLNVGASIQDLQYTLDGFGGKLLNVPNLFAYRNVNPAEIELLQRDEHDQFQSVFANAQVAWQNKLFLDLTGRSDWASALANTQTASFFYPSVGVSAILTDLFKMRSPVLSFAKARVSYSEVGNAPPREISQRSFEIIGGFPATTSYMPPEVLEPERTKSYEAGLSLRLLKNKIFLDVTAYKSNTYNQLFNPALAPSTGFSSFYINAGNVENKGIEAVLGYKNSIAKGLDWNSSVTFTLNRNKIIQLLPSGTKDPVTGQPVKLDSLSMGGTGSYIMSLVEGGSIGDVYVTTLKTDEHGYIVVGLVSQTVIADPTRYIFAGNANPRYTLGFRNGFSYKNFDFDFLVNARVGGVCVSVTQAIMDRFGVSEASAKARDEGGVIINGEKIPAQPYFEVVGGGVAGVGAAYVYSATNLRLAEASLSYTFPAKFFRNKIQGITVSITGRNLFLFSEAPFDPEATANTGTYFQGVDYFMQPSLRSVGFGVNVQF